MMVVSRRFPVIQDHRTAFTLVEMVIVVVIIGVAASIAVPRFTGFLAKQHLDAAATRITSDLAFAQSRAKFTGASQKILFFTDLEKYKFPEFDDPDHPEREYEVDLRQEPYNASIESVDLGGDQMVTFDGFGVPDSDGTIVITAGGLERTITLDALTGHVTVSPAITKTIVVPEELE